MGLSSKQVSHDDTLDWSQIGTGVLEIAADASNGQQARRQPPLRCPRCDSHNTKFCYYNNYSRLQPRHFCRACRRHWTAGGTLRNVPVGGGRKNKRAKTDSGDQSRGSSITNNIAIQQFGDGGLEGTVFPDVFKQLLFYSPDQGGGSSSAPPPPHLLMPELAGTAKYSEGDVLVNPLPGSASSSSPHSNHDITDLFLTLMPSSTANTWLQDPPPLPSSDYSSWWDDTADFVAAPGFEQSATANE